MSAILRKSVTDLTRRKARAFFTVLTLGAGGRERRDLRGPRAHAAVDGPRDRRQQARRRDRCRPSRWCSSDAQLERLRALPNVEAVGAEEPVLHAHLCRRAAAAGAASSASPTSRARTPTSSRRSSGSAPAAGAVLTDNQNAPKGKFEGTTARVIAADGSVRSLPVSGEGRNLFGGSLAATEDFADVLRVAGDGGAAQRRPRLHLVRPAPARLQRAPPPTARSRPCATSCAASRASTASPSCPLSASPASTPARRCFEQIASVMTVVTLLALLSALVLLSNTMTTLIGEQTSRDRGDEGDRRLAPPDRADLPAHRADARRARRGARRGARRRARQRARRLLRQHRSSASTPASHVDAGGARRQPRRRADRPAAGGAAGDPPRLPAAGPRGAAGDRLGGRRPGPARRAAAARAFAAAQRPDRAAQRRAAQAPHASRPRCRSRLAVATLLALLSLGTSRRQPHARLLRRHALRRLGQHVRDAAVHRRGHARAGLDPGRRGASSRCCTNGAKVAGKDAGLVGHGRRAAGCDCASRAAAGTRPPRRRAARAVAVARHRRSRRPPAHRSATPSPRRPPPAPRALRDRSGSCGSPVSPDSSTCRSRRLQKVLGTPGRGQHLLDRSDSTDHAYIDRLTTRLEDTLGAHGTPITTIAWYDQKADNVAQNAQLTTTITVLGLVIVAISMVGLVNAITMGILERTREIGMLRVRRRPRTRHPPHLRHRGHRHRGHSAG